ncbi:hypothetical protein CAPTEDRAFT_198113 [Capitella teleta]|uniref:Uncharacterized protein n=1 Tax=Capitella teleta TaxID=283909 RepID=X1ZYA8_CAPTE|nr:hypothetical protein CAPTEDRAFT_198113 [Capitella teleta]|eukprot:ELU04660.1 hypothetical protein CAPTEDRAFT_198113 [Capitella teleta]
MAKFAAKRSGSALVWNENVRKNVERMQNEYGRWMWRLERTVRNAAVHGESGWSLFWEREVKAKVAFVVRVLEEDGLVARVGRACLMEIGVRSKWWKKIGKMTEELGVDVLLNLVLLRRMSAIGVAEMGICEDEREGIRKVELERRVQEVGRMRWEEQLQRNERTRRYAQEKGEMKLEPYADGQEGAGVRLMMRGDCLPVRMNECVRWKYGEDERRCTCGEEEIERHVLFECVLYERLREEWLRRWREERGEEDLVEGVLGFAVTSADLERLVLRSVGKIWKERKRRERER